MADTNPAHEEVWDDTALLDSWNEAFAEYKKYHSIAVKGGKISPSPKTSKHGLSNGDKPSLATTTTKRPQDEGVDSDEYDPSVGQASKSGQAAPGAFAAAAAAMPQALMANVQDDNMKSIMMSWYYAGYYTGLYEGKQQGYLSAVQQLQQEQQEEGG